jgi:hypothetical protein
LKPVEIADQKTRSTVKLNSNCALSERRPTSTVPSVEKILGGVSVMKTKISIKTAVSALFLLAVAAFAPACEVFNPDPCDPRVEVCPVTPNHPTTLNNG